MSRKIFTAAALLFGLLPIVSAAEQVFETTFPGKGRHTFTFTIKIWGRYSIQAFNAEGTSLQLVDKKSGPGPTDGIPGEKNGRLDLLLEEGEYKLIALSHREGKNNTTVKIFRFDELNQNNPQYGIPFKLHEAELRDLQQISYWFNVNKDTTVFLEALGRNLADLKLWKDGSWLVEAEWQSFRSYPSAETPLKGIRLAAKVDAGLYLATAYAGLEADWPKNSAKQPFFLKWGIPRFATTGEGLYDISPTGYNQYLVAKQANRILIETDKKVFLKLEASSFSVEQPFQAAVATDSIHAKANAPRCVISPYSGGAPYYLIKVTGKPGQFFLLQTLEPSSGRRSLNEAGNYWLSTMHTGAPGDQIGAAGFVITNSNSRLLTAQLDTLASDRTLQRRFNLLAETNLFVWVAESGAYDVVPEGVEATWKIERSFINVPPNYRAPSGKQGKGAVDLEPGLHTLQLSPNRKGIFSLRIKKSSLISFVKDMASRLTSQQDTTWISGLPRIQFPLLNLVSSPREGYTFILNSQAPELAGVILRKLPMSFDEPLPIYAAPRQKITIPITVVREAQLSVKDILNRHYAFTLDGVSHKSLLVVPPGSHTFIFENTSDKAAWVSAKTEPLDLLSATPPKPLAPATLASLPKFPALNSGQTVFLDLARNEAKIYQFNVAQSGIYRLETTGRLHTALTIRSRFETHLESADGNGVGRNAMLLIYLLAGQYQIKVNTLGESTGHLGLSLKTNELIQGGKLEPGRDNRWQVPTSAGIVHQFEVLETGRYRVISLGQEGYFKARIEDNDGYPILKPGLEADIEMIFDRGSYQLLSLPENRESRRIARFEKIEPAVTFTGKGPHALAINKLANSTWVEEVAESKRKPAVFRFQVTAPMKVKLFLSDGFEAALKFVDRDTILFKWRGAQEQQLAMGPYEIAVMAEKEQNYVDYQLAVNTEVLAPGLSYVMEQPQTFKVSLGKSSVVELFSQGTTDVSAKLFVADGRTLTGQALVAENDDAFLDWNFNVSQFLPAGTYYLQIQSEKGAFAPAPAATPTAASAYESASESEAEYEGESEEDGMEYEGEGEEEADEDESESEAATPASENVPTPEPAREATLQTIVSMRSLADTLLAAIASGKSLAIDLAGKIATIPLQKSPASNVIHVGVTGQSLVGVSIEEMKSAGPPRVRGTERGKQISLSMPVPAEGQYQLRVWSEDHLNENISLSYEESSALPTTLGNLRNWSGEVPQNSLAHKKWFRVDMRADSLAHYLVAAPQNAANSIQTVRAALFANTLFQQEEGNYFSSLRRELWLEVAFAKAGKSEFKLTPYSLVPDKDMTIQLIDNIPRAFSMNTPSNRLSIFTVEMEPGQPIAGIAATTKGYFYPHDIPVQAGQYLASGKCLTADFPEDFHKLIVWNASSSRDGSRTYAKIRQQTIPLNDRATLKYGHQQWSSTQPGSMQYSLPDKGRYRLRVKIPAGGIAIWKPVERERQIFAAETDLHLVEFSAVSGNLFLADLTGGRQFFVELIGIEGTAQESLPLALDEGLEQSFPSDGEFIVPLASDEATQPVALYYDGAVDEVSWYSAGGILKTDLSSGESLLSSPREKETVSQTRLGGFLKIRHRGGWIKFNLAEKDNAFARKWGYDLRPQNPVDLNKPVEVTLKDGLNWFSFTLNENLHVRFQSDKGLVGIMKAEERVINYKTDFDALDWDMPLKPGKYFLGVRGLAGESAEGARLTYSFRSIDVLAEKSPPTVSLAPGETRLFRFTLPEQKIIGLGLRTQKEVVQARLYDGEWRLINRGKQQFKTLEKGDYYLWLHVPLNQDATVCTPILVGQEAPPNRPPESVISRIVGGK